MARIGMDSSSYRLHLEDLDHQRDPLWFVHKTLDWGLDGCSFNPKHLRGWDENLVRGIGQACQQHNLYLELTTTGSDYARLCRRLILAAEANARILRTSISENYSGTSEEQRRVLLRFAAENLKRLAEVAECVGVVLAIEGQGQVTTREIVSIIEDVDSPCVRASLSNAEVLKAFEDPVESAAALTPYLAGVLLRDCRLSYDDELSAYEGCVLGEGTARVGDVYRLIRQSCPRLPITLEMGCSSPGGAFRTQDEEEEQVRHSIGFVRSLEQNRLFAD